MGKRLLVFGAHPDDCEIGMGGTIHKMAKEGYEIIIIDLTRGEMSSNGNVFLRQKESEAARKIMGASIRINLGFEDRNIVKNKKILK